MTARQELVSMSRQLQGIEDPRVKELMRVMIDNIKRLDHNTGHLADNPVPTNQLDSPFVYPEEVLWTDYLASMATGKGAASAPSMQTFNTTWEALRFGTGDGVYMYFHINHDIKEGTNVYPHIHWAKGTGTDTNIVKWQIDYTIAKGHDQEAFPATTTVTVEGTPPVTPWWHMISEVSAADSFEAPEVDSIVIIKVERISNGGSNNNDEIFGLFVDLHAEIDRPGTPNKAPDFYTV